MFLLSLSLTYTHYLFTRKLRWTVALPLRSLRDFFDVSFRLSGLPDVGWTLRNNVGNEWNCQLGGGGLSVCKRGSWTLLFLYANYPFPYCRIILIKLTFKCYSNAYFLLQFEKQVIVAHSSILCGIPLGKVLFCKKYLTS